ncbi:MAG: hypothetical protein NTY45_03955 [Elusimicrobia bacterium]|nr:hypothetical protein [Elusimicrobiota bacterium]
MDKATLTKRYLTAAAAAGGIIAAIVFYTLIVEFLKHRGYTPPLVPPAAYVLKFALYLTGASALAALKLAGRAEAVKKPTPGETILLLTRLALLRAAVCELPAVSGLILFILTGYYWDFYLLAAFALVLELANFPRPGAWEERLRSDFGQLPE